MKSTILLTLLVVTVTAAPARADDAVGTGHVSIAGVPPFSIGGEAVIGLTGIPLRIGVAGGYAPNVVGGLAGWLEGGLPVADRLAAGVIVGANQRWDPAACPRDSTGAVPCVSTLEFGRPGLLLGAYAAYWVSDSVWVRITPHVTLVLQDPIPVPQTFGNVPASWPDGTPALAPRAQAPLKLSIGF